MQISEEYIHSPKFTLPHNVKLSVRSLVDLFLSVIIIWAIRRHTNSCGIEKLDSLSSVSYSKLFLLLFITWGLSCFWTGRDIETPLAYGQSISHDPTCNFLGSSQYGQTSTSPQFTRIIFHRKSCRDKLDMGMTQVHKMYYLFMWGGILKQHFVLIMLTRCHSISEYGLVLKCILMKLWRTLWVGWKNFWVNNNPVKYG